MYGLITDGGTRSGKTVQEGFASLLRRTGEEIPLGGFKEFAQPGLRFGDPVPGHFQQKVMFILIAPGFHALRQVGGEDIPQLLHKAVGEVRFKQRHLFEHRVGAAFHGEE